MKLELREITASPAAKAKAGIIRNVICLGQRSKNGRVYSRKAMKAAASLMEGVAVYVNHATPEDRARGGRAAEDRFGRLHNVRFVDSTPPEVRGDLHYLRAHPLSEAIAEDLDLGLNFFGLSLFGDGSGIEQADGTVLVENVSRVLSVDVVSGAATCKGFREQALALAEQARTGPTATRPRKVREPFPTNLGAREQARWLSKYCSD